MKVIDFCGVHEATNDKELEIILQRRQDGGVNAFCLFHGSKDYPKLSLLVKGDLATLNYFPKENEAGFCSIGKMPRLKAGGSTTFAISENRADDLVVLNDKVVPFSVALRVAKEFYFSKDLPGSIKWLQL